MPKVPKHKENRLYNEVMKGKSGQRALLDAGFSPNTASHPPQAKILQTVYKRINEEFKLTKITPEYVLNHIDVILNGKASPSDKLRATELLGRFLALFKDKHEITTQSLSPSDITKEVLDEARQILAENP